MRRVVLLMVAVSAANVARAQPPPAADLDALLEQVRTGWQQRDGELRAREAEFAAQRDRQQAELERARAQRARINAQSAELEQAFNENEAALAQLEERLRLRMGDLGELFGVVRQVAGETQNDLRESLITAQFPERGGGLQAMADARAVPSIEELRGLWFALQQEITESSRVARFEAEVAGVDGTVGRRRVTRVGAFNAVASGAYLNWSPQEGRLVELARQPARRYLSTATDLEEASATLVRFAVDPSRGALLALLVETPSMWERIELGGVIGYIIIALGLMALLIALLRLIVLTREKSRVARQRADPTPSEDNSLGRIMKAYADNASGALEALDLKLDEAVVKEQSSLERLLWAVKVISVVAPLLGLLGTVTGMIQTFQAITLYGTGDPQLMAGGISEALVTTMLGLIVAIPLVLLHSGLRTLSRGIVEVLTEQSAGIIASHAAEGALDRD